MEVAGRGWRSSRGELLRQRQRLKVRRAWPLQAPPVGKRIRPKRTEL